MDAGKRENLPMTKNRLEAFSDGVFAIVITLLVLDVRFPADKPLTLETLGGVMPHVLAFVLSFLVCIGSRITTCCTTSRRSTGSSSG
jgi:uncharacterized membrane protein